MSDRYFFSLSENSLCIMQSGELLISDIEGYLKYPGKHYNVLTVNRQGAWTVEGQTAVCASMKLELRDYRGGFMIRSVFTNTEGYELPAFCEFTAFAGHLHRTVDGAIINTPFCANGNRVNDMLSEVRSVRTVYNDIYDSAENTVFTTEEGDSFVFGQLSYEKYFSCVSLTREGYLTAHASTELHNIPVGASVYSEWFWFSPVEEPVSGLEVFAKAVAAYAGAAYSERKNPSGFCTWYYYGKNIRQNNLFDNMEVLDAHKTDIPVQYIQIDAGWYDATGAWNCNDGFPDMPAFVRKIESHGYRAGIWIAPFSFDGKAAAITEHPDWFVKNADGALWKSYSLDYTNPEVREYMGKIFHRLSYEWGFRYIKIDLISGALAPGLHHDPDATALKNYRLGLKTARENITADTFLLDCTAPLGGACGLVDGMRVSCDIFERWDSVRDVFNAVFKRYYYHRNYYLIDADCLLVRKKENEDAECWRLCTRTDNEIRTFVTAMAASGGILMLSDKLPNLTKEQFALISKLFPMHQNCARPLDLMDSRVPGVLDFGMYGKTRTVALINWSDVPRKMSVENKAALVFEFWEKQTSFHDGGTFNTLISPHTAKVFYFTVPDDLCVIGSDASVMMQNEWCTAMGRISGKRQKDGEHIFVAAKGTLGVMLGDTDGCTVLSHTEIGEYTVYEAVCDKNKYSICLH